MRPKWLTICAWAIERSRRIDVQRMMINAVMLTLACRRRTVVGAWAHHLLRLAVAAAMLLLVGVVHAQTKVSVPSRDLRAGEQRLTMPGFWFEAASTTPAAAVVLLHGCNGPYANGAASTQTLSVRMRDQAKRMNALGMHVLVTDSLTPRGETELCTQSIGGRRVTQRERRLDALGAMQWLAEQPNVKKESIGLIGWSHGGSAVLAATDTSHRDVQAAPVRASLAVAFYPGCTASLTSGYRSGSPLLMLVGDADDWTPAQPCKDLAARTNTIQLVAYPGAYHGFDSKAPVTLLKHVPSGVNPGQGVHVGGQAVARLDAEVQLAAFIQKHWGNLKP
jgi:dienelactone hydrolase